MITPFFCKELGQMVLVNRGWVPKRKMDPETRAAGQVRKERVLLFDWLAVSILIVFVSGRRRNHTDSCSKDTRKGILVIYSVCVFAQYMISCL